MIQEDYIIKIIKKAMEFISKALGLAKEGEFLQSENILKDSYEDITGVSMNTLISVDVDSMNHLIGNNAAEVIVTGEYCKALGKIYKEKADFENFVKYYKKGLYLMLANYHRDIYEININILLLYGPIKGYLDDEVHMKLLYEFFMDRVAYKKAIEVVFAMMELTDNKHEVVMLGENFYSEVLTSNDKNMKKAKWTYEQALDSKEKFEKLKEKTKN
ncbi:MAG: hypothetical protein KAG94_00765 [Clostridiales bacterium]|nr:hypothetical protein [Clostridiales bacterium]